MTTSAQGDPATSSSRCSSPATLLRSSLLPPPQSRRLPDDRGAHAMAAQSRSSLFLRTLGGPVLQSLRLQPGATPAALFPAASSLFRPRFYSDAAGTYLDRNSVTERVLNVVKNFPKVDPAKVTGSSSFQKDLGLDSLDTVEVVMAFEEEFAVEIPDADADKILTTSDAIDYFASHPQAK